MPEPHPKEVRDDVVRVARNGEPGQHLKQIASDFGISESCLTGWLKAADVGPPVPRRPCPAQLHRRRPQAVVADRHALGRLTPVEFETIMTTPATQAA